VTLSLFVNLSTYPQGKTPPAICICRDYSLHWWSTQFLRRGGFVSPKSEGSRNKIGIRDCSPASIVEPLCYNRHQRELLAGLAACQIGAERTFAL